ncbi:hypothetical protein F8388_015837 [Cannabis sativa]|uniref:CCHC-type domain-containing protein n=1 Tax=Cannabis sativa TaxID=3483 RepID=A0A7J6HI17_CANSA|nr:hypothetical protein F8388_015837 [Cannabis sativa]KAF4394914.1 hypothetical protein G4B88_002791 [Cannabis sativa]
MDNFHPDISNALSTRERAVISINDIATPPPHPATYRLLCRIFSSKGHNPKQLKNFILTQWVGRFAVQFRTMTLKPTLIWSLLAVKEIKEGKSESLAKILGNLIGTYIDVHDDSLNEGWDPFLRIWVGIDVLKPLLRGQMVSFPWMEDELWLDYCYERLPDFCYECGIIGHVFDKCPIFLEKIDDGKEPSLPYGPWMEGSSLPRSAYDRYMQDFSKADPWPFITRLAWNSISPIIPHANPFPVLPEKITATEKKKVAETPNTLPTHSNISLPPYQKLPNLITQGNSTVDLPPSSSNLGTDKHVTYGPSLTSPSYTTPSVEEDFSRKDKGNSKQKNVINCLNIDSQLQPSSISASVAPVMPTSPTYTHMAPLQSFTSPLLHTESASTVNQPRTLTSSIIVTATQMTHPPQKKIPHQQLKTEYHLCLPKDSLLQQVAIIRLSRRSESSCEETEKGDVGEVFGMVENCHGTDGVFSPKSVVFPPKSVD